ncbi:MAG: epoxyqueuosine reductase, partial [Candidatus Endobugula sp.]
YLTIELKESIPTAFEGKMENWLFGCDICQDVCPWNRFSSSHKETSLLPKEGLLELFNKNWEDLTEEVFKSVFKKSAVKRTKIEGLKRNIEIAKKGDPLK